MLPRRTSRNEVSRSGGRNPELQTDLWQQESRRATLSTGGTTNSKSMAGWTGFAGILMLIIGMIDLFHAVEGADVAMV